MAKKLGDILSAANNTKQEKEDNIKAQVLHAFARVYSDHDQFVDDCNTADLYYTCQLPKNTLKDASDYTVGGKEFVYPAVFNTIKAATPQQLDAFLKNDDVAVEFRSRGFRKDAMLEQLINYNINRKFLREGNGKNFLRGVIQSTFLHGAAPVKLFVSEKTYTETDNLTDWMEYSEYMQGLDEGWTISTRRNKFGVSPSGNYKGFEWKEEKETVQNPQTGEETEQEVILIKGSVPLIKIDRKIDWQEIEPQDFYFDSCNGDDITKAPYLAHRINTTIGEAELMGYDPDKLVNAPDESTDDNVLPQMYYSQTNYSSPEARGRLDYPQSTDPKQRRISLIEHYIYSSYMHPKGETRPYQVVTCGDEILSVTEVKRFPFVLAKMERTQGQFLGRGLFHLAKQFQDHLSVSQRLHEAVALQTTYPKYLAVNGQFDRQSLLQNRPGAVIAVAAQGAVERFEPFQLTETFISASNSLKEIAQETLTQPTDITNNDGGMSQVATATAYLNIFSQAQQEMMITENLADTLFKPFFTMFYQMNREEGIQFVDPDNNPIDASMLPSVFELAVDPETTNDQFAQHMQVKDLVALAQIMSSFQASYFSDQNKYEVLKRICDDFDLPLSFVTDPQTQRDPQAEHEQAEHAAIVSESLKVDLETKKVEMRKAAAETFKIEQEAEELIRNGQTERQVKHSDSMLKLQKIMNDAQHHAQSDAVRAQEVAVKEKAVNYEAILGAAKHATDITAPNVNGVR